MTSIMNTAVVSLVLASLVVCHAQTDPKNVPQPPTAELSKFDPFLGKYEVSGDFAGLPWAGTLELKRVIKGWYIEQIILIKSPGIDREFWLLATWDGKRQKYPLWGFQTLPVLPANDGEVRFEGDEMITQWTSPSPDGAVLKLSNRYRLVSKDGFEIVSYKQVGNAAPEKIGFLQGRRIGPDCREANQQINPAFLGYWMLNVDKSDFAGRLKPKGGFVNWGERGWTFALTANDGRLYADAVDTDDGCHLVGVFSNWSCEVEVVSQRHIRLTMKQGEAIRRVGDIEILENGTTRTTHRVTPRDGAPYIETTIWEKQVAK